MGRRVKHRAYGIAGSYIGVQTPELARHLTTLRWEYNGGKQRWWKNQRNGFYTIGKNRESVLVAGFTK